jgi:hypothetical protein
MQQRDSRISQTISEQSTKIAVASKRDSSAMKAIAVLTMLFLPGTAIAVRFGPLNRYTTILIKYCSPYLAWAASFR